MPPLSTFRYTSSNLCKSTLKMKPVFGVTQKYPGKTAPNASTITCSVQRFRDTGSVAGRKRSGSVHSENESGRRGDRFTKKSTEKTVRQHIDHYGIHSLAGQ
ncbi:hypothetical protein TNCV_445171 [Trichonephila clavipes]|nr:hypothetical protein TNCV_445171 [Trichonephila clavipes]